MKISIITVTYNSASVIEDCLNSVKGQTYNDVEHIVVDGLSSDSTLSILNSKKNQLSNLIIEEDNGIYDAMNKGIRLAKGDIIGFLNSDDFYASKDVLSNVANTFDKKPSIQACYADLIYIDKKKLSKIIRYWKSSDFIPGLFMRGWCPPHPTFFARRTVYENFGGFNLDYSISADFELMFRLLEIKKISVDYVPEIWVKMRTGGTSNKNFKNIWLQNQEIIRAFQSHGISVNLVSFFFQKIIFRALQFLNKPKNKKNF
jgi:glycosyltransferase involved in cell wall biosynthesis